MSLCLGALADRVNGQGGGTYPSARIDVIVSAYQEPLARRYQWLDHVLVTPPYPGLDFGEVDQAAIGEFYLEAGNRQYDLALQFAGGGINSNRYTVQLGASLTVGHCEAGAVKLDFCLPYAPDAPRCFVFSILPVWSVPNLPQPT